MPHRLTSRRVSFPHPWNMLYAAHRLVSRQSAMSSVASFEQPENMEAALPTWLTSHRLTSTVARLVRRNMPYMPVALPVFQPDTSNVASPVHWLNR